MPFCHKKLSAEKPIPSDYPASPETIAEHIKKRRIDLNLLQREVAEILGVDKSTVENWEQNRTSPNLRAWPAVIKFVGYDPRPPGRNIGEKLRLHREGHGLSWVEAAKTMGVDPATVSKWENQPDERFNHRSIPSVVGFLGYNPLPPPETPGQYIRHLRYLSGLKQTEFSAWLGMSNNTVSEWELGKKLPTMEHLASVEAISLSLPKPIVLTCPEPIKAQCAAEINPTSGLTRTPTTQGD